MLLKKWLILPPHTHTLLGRFSIIDFSEWILKIAIWIAVTVNGPENFEVK